MTFSKVCMLIGYFFNDCCFMARYFKETKSNRKFPNRVLFFIISDASSCIVLCHQVQAIRNLAYYRCFGKSKTEVCAE